MLPLDLLSSPSKSFYQRRFFQFSRLSIAKSVSSPLRGEVKEALSRKGFLEDILLRIERLEANWLKSL